MAADLLVLDTNVYIDSLDDVARGTYLASLIADTEDNVAVSSVVVAELAAGSHAGRDRDRLIADFVGTSSRILTPTHEDWLTAADALRSLGGDALSTRRAFWNDLLIAASCVRADALLMTSNRDDFARIQR